MRVVAIIQARMSSRRLPGKVLRDLAGKPVLEHVVGRLAACRLVDDIVVATSADSSDDPVYRYCTGASVDCFRGSLEDVLNRFVRAGREFRADWVVRMLADCPLVDPVVVDACVAGAVAGDYDCYGLDGDFPDGLDCTVYKLSALEKAAAEARLPSEREHVGPYIIGHPEIFRVGRLELFSGLGHHRWTLDEQADFDFLEALLPRLPAGFGVTDVLDVLRRNPGLAEMNAGIERNEGYRRSVEEESAAPPAGSGQALYQRALQLVPGGTQLLSKRPELFAPGEWPAYYSRGKGCRVWDLDGRELIDMSTMSVGAAVLGYADDDVDRAVHDAVSRGVATSLNCPEEIELAEALLERHPWFDRVRYARSGGEAMAMAVRIARASTGRDAVLFSGYHGWSDWYLAANLGDAAALDGQLMPGLDPAGVPRGLLGTAIPFSVGDAESLDRALDKAGGSIAALVVEPARAHDAPAEHLAMLRSFADAHNAVLVFDEITSGFRMCSGGIHRRYDVRPDIAVFAKSMANGYAMAVVVGVEAVMEAAQGTFISSTNWTERIGPVAALATLRKYESAGAAEHIIRMGERCKEIWRASAASAGLEITVSGLPSLASFAFVSKHPAAMATRFVSEMLDRGFLAFRQFKPSLAHTDDDLNRYAVATAEVFQVIARLEPPELLRGPVAHAGFHRLTPE